MYYKNILAYRNNKIPIIESNKMYQFIKDQQSQLIFILNRNIGFHCTLTSSKLELIISKHQILE